MIDTVRKSVDRVERIQRREYDCYECGKETRNDLISKVYVTDSDRMTEMHAVVCDDCIQLYTLEAKL